MKIIVQNLAQKYKEDFIKIRRHLHQHPELSFQEFNTAAYIKQELEALDIPYESCTETGIIALIKGQHPEHKTIALRADIDALPIQEQNNSSYASQNSGVMHACGHDVHTTCLLGAARILQELRSKWKGQIKLFFQPGEEKLPGGASLMIAQGALKNPQPDLMLGQHVEPLMPVGCIGIKNGQFMASADEIYVTVKGKGGHAARPHKCVDTILLAAELISSMQQIISRRTDPLMPSVLSFGKIFSEGGATNIIPNEVKIWGTFRTFDEKWRTEAHELMQQMAKQLCQSMGGDCEFEIVKGYPSVHNEEDLTNRLRVAAKDYLGADKVIELPARMGGEDFGFYAQELPACFYRLGVQNPNGTGLHTPQFDIDESALEYGAGLMAFLALEELR